MDVTCYKGKQLSLYVTEAIQEKQLNHQIALYWQEMPDISFKYFILIIIVENMLFACSETELKLTVITVRNDLLRNVPPILPRKIVQTGHFEQYLSLSFQQGTRLVERKEDMQNI